MTVDIDALISATDLNRTPGRFLDLAAAGTRQIVLSQNKPIAAIISIEDLRRLQQFKKEDNAVNRLPDSTVITPQGCTTIGRTTTGHPVTLALTCHTLVVGATGSGKSVTLSAALANAAVGASDLLPVQFIVAEGRADPPAMVHSDAARTQPQPPIVKLATGLRDDPQAADDFLAWIMAKFEYRRALLADEGVADVDDYNRAAWRRAGAPLLNHQIIVFDEALTSSSHGSTAAAQRDVLAALLDRGRILGLHLWIFSQPGFWAEAAAAKCPQLVIQRLNHRTDLRALLGGDAAADTSLTRTGEALLKRSDGRLELFKVFPPDADPAPLCAASQIAPPV